MATSYPAGYDAFTAITTETTATAVGGRTHKQMHNDVNDSVEAIEAELGLDPAGASATVVARFDALDTTAAAAALKAANLSDLASASTSRTNLGLGTMAVAAAADYAALAGAAFTGVTSVAADFSVTSAASKAKAIVDGANTSGNGPMVSLRRAGTEQARIGTASAIVGGTDDALMLWTASASANPIYLRVYGTTTGRFESTGNTFNAYSATAIPAILKGAAAQSANLSEWQNSSATVLASVSAAGKVTTAASTTAAAGLNTAHGTAPTSPVDGDIWTTTAGLYVRVNGSTVGPLS